MSSPAADARATRAEGIATRRRLLDNAAALFMEHGLGGVSVKSIADAAEVFPSQLTYYFGTKDALFVEAACREVLHVGAAVEKAGSGATTPSGYVEAIVGAALDAPSLLLFAEAMSVARFDTTLQARIEETLDRLHVEGSRAVTEVCEGHGWTLATSAEVQARSFWSIVTGVATPGSN